MFLRELGRVPIPLPPGGIDARATIEALVTEKGVVRQPNADKIAATEL